MLGMLKRYGFAAAVVGVVMLMALVVAGKTVFSAFGEPGAAASARAKGGPSGPPPSVVAAVVEAHRFTDGLRAIGAAQARESIVLTPKVADTIRALRFESGDRVRRGQVLVEMSSVEQSADLSEARAADEAAQGELRRYRELYDRGFASQARLDAVQALADAARARVNAGASRIADRTIRAPFAGIVGLRNASPGQFVRPGDQIGTLDDISTIKLDFSVPETVLARVRQGVALEARTQAYPERAFSGVIADMDSRVDPATRTVRVRAILPNRDEILRPGMLMTVSVQSNPRTALAVPEVAIIDEADGAFVFRIAARDGVSTAERIAIQTGQRADGMAEVLSGLSAGDRVVVEGLQAIRPGQPIRPRTAEAAPALRPRG